MTDSRADESDMLSRPMSSKHVFRTLDGIRGLCAILVVLRHTTAFFGTFQWQETYLAVDVFFLLSGVVVSHAYEDRLLSDLEGWRFAAMRAIRIYPLYLAGCAISVVGALSGIDPMSPSLLALFVALAFFLLPNPGFGGQPIYPLNAPSWTLLFEMLANVFYGLFVRQLGTARLVCILVVSALGNIVGVCLSRSHSLDIGWTLKGLAFGFSRVGFSFFAGVLLMRAFKSGRKPLWLLGDFSSRFVPVIAMAAVFSLLVAAPSDTFRPYYDFAVVTFAFPAVIYVALWAEPSGKSAVVFGFLGATSYAMYALHEPVGRFIEGVFSGKLGLPVERYAPGSGLILLAGLLLLCWALDKAYDAPVRKALLSRLKKMGRPR